MSRGDGAPVAVFLRTADPRSSGSEPSGGAGMHVPCAPGTSRAERAGRGPVILISFWIIRYVSGAQIDREPLPIRHPSAAMRPWTRQLPPVFSVRVVAGSSQVSLQQVPQGCPGRPQRP